MECVLRELITTAYQPALIGIPPKGTFTIQVPCELALLVGLSWKSVGEGPMPRKESKTCKLGKPAWSII